MTFLFTKFICRLKYDIRWNRIQITEYSVVMDTVYRWLVIILLHSKIHVMYMSFSKHNTLGVLLSWFHQCFIIVPCLDLKNLSAARRLPPCITAVKSPIAFLHTAGVMDNATSLVVGGTSDSCWSDRYSFRHEATNKWKQHLYAGNAPAIEGWQNATAICVGAQIVRFIIVHVLEYSHVHIQAFP